MPDISSNNDALRALLERLFPDIEISETGVSLLAVQMAQMENVPRPLDDSVLSREPIEIAASATRLSIMFPYPIGRMINYESDNSE